MTDWKPSLSLQLLTAGTAACIADLFTFPLDTTKVRLQVQGEGGRSCVGGRGVGGTMLHIARTEGLSALYSGIVPGLQRQMAFSAIRIGGYERVKETYMEMTGVEAGVGLMAVRVAAGVTTGTLAILAAQPTDVVKVRMQVAGGRQQYKVSPHSSSHVISPSAPGRPGCLSHHQEERGSGGGSVQGDCPQHRP